MSKASPAITSFNGGELSPLMEGRTDIAKYQTGCTVLENFIPTVQGPIVSRGGTRFVDNALRNTYSSWLGRFEFNYAQAFILEFNHNWLGFFTNRGRLQVTRTITDIVDNGAGFCRVESVGHGFVTGQTVVIAGVVGPTINGTWDSITLIVIDADHFDIGAGFDAAYVSGGTATVDYILSTPYTSSSMVNDDGSWALSRLQTGDVVYLAGGGAPPQKLTRTANTQWAIAAFAPDDGPFLDMNETAVTMSVSAVTGSVNVTASAATFTADHVGALIRIERKDAEGIEPWAVNRPFTTNDYCLSDGKTYKCTDNYGNTNSGTVQPTHTRGKADDGVANERMEWEYQDAGYGVARITSITSPTVAVATVITDLQFPASLVSTASKRWSFGAWGDHNEWPTRVTLWRDRLVWSGLRDVWLSKAGEYEKMAPDEFGEQLTDSAINVRIQSRDNNAIRWMQSANALFVGTAAAEYVIDAQTTSEPLGPANIKATPKSHFGGSGITPLQVGAAVVFPEKDRRVVREILYDPDGQPYTIRDLTVLSDHVTESGLIDLAYQRKGGALIWGVREDGQLIGLTYEVEQEVYGWHRHPMGDAEVKSVQAIPAPDGTSDDVWLCVERTVVDGAPFRKLFIERITAEYTSGVDPSKAVCLDSSMERDGAVAATLTVGAGATTVGTTSVPFTAGSAAFVSGDVGRYIFYRYRNTAGKWLTAKALITGYTSSVTVLGTITAAFPSTAALASGAWALSATTVTGIVHLNGLTVSIVADGSVLPDAQVSGGSLTITRPSNIVQVGIRYAPRMRTMRPDAGSRDGTAQGKTKRTKEVVYRFLNTGGCEYGPDFERMDPFQFRRTSDLTDEAVPLFTGDKTVPWQGTYETDGYVCLNQPQPLPVTLVAIYPRVNTSD